MLCRLKSGRTYLSNDLVARAAAMGNVIEAYPEQIMAHTNHNDTVQSSINHGSQHHCAACRARGGDNSTRTSTTSVPPRHGVAEDTIRNPIAPTHTKRKGPQRDGDDHGDLSRTDVIPPRLKLPQLSLGIYEVVSCAQYPTRPVAAPPTYCTNNSSADGRQHGRTTITVRVESVICLCASMPTSLTPRADVECNHFRSGTQGLKVRSKMSPCPNNQWQCVIN